MKIQYCNKGWEAKKEQMMLNIYRKHRRLTVFVTTRLLRELKQEKIILRIH